MIKDKLNKLLSEGKVGDLLTPMSDEEAEKTLGHLLGYRVRKMLDEAGKNLENKGWKKQQYVTYRYKKDNSILSFYEFSNLNDTKSRVTIYYIKRPNTPETILIDEMIRNDEDIEKVRKMLISTLTSIYHLS
jgi:hypothetical protein